jgi:hypothetical protein
MILEIGRMWKCGRDGIYFNNTFPVSLWKSCTVPNWVPSGSCYCYTKHKEGWPKPRHLPTNVIIFLLLGNIN